MAPTNLAVDMDSYQLRGSHIGPQVVIEISAERHVAHVMARKCLIDAGNFERRYELLLGNFLAFEEFCAVSHMRSKVHMDWGYESGDSLLMEANRHVVNVFTSGKTYVDQVGRDFNFIGKECGFADRARALFSASYDRSLDYRLTCQLRDRAQHRAMPVDGYDGGPGPGARDDVWFYGSKERIAADPGKFKKLVLDEAPDKIYLRSMLRGFMREISGVHIALRKMVNSETEASRALFSLSIKEYTDAQKEPGRVSKTGIGLQSVHQHELAIIEAVPLLLNWDDNRKRLAEKNRLQIKLPV